MNNNPEKDRPLRIGEVYNMYFSGTGSEQNGWRPGVVFQNNVGNANSPNIIALPLTSSLKKLHMPTHVLIKSNDTGLRYDSLVLCENPEKMSKEKIGFFITELPIKYMRDIAIANLTATSAISFIDKDSLINTWEKAVDLNRPA